VRIAICDDECTFREKLSKAIKTYGELPADAIIDEFSDGQSLVEAHKEKPFNTIFLDIEMSEMSGMEAGAMIRRFDREVIIILVTGHESFMKDSFKIEVFDFITKPYEELEIHEVLERAFRKHQDLHYIVELNWKGNTASLKASEIIYIMIEDRHIVAVTEDKEHRCLGKLDYYEKLLSKYGFFRCHKSYIVNLDMIRSVKGKIITLSNNTVINISQSKKNEFLGAYSEFIAKYRI